MALQEIFVSWRLAPDARPEQVGELFKQARVCSAQHGLTGLLVFDGEYLVAHLEGEADAVQGALALLGCAAWQESASVQHASPLLRRSYARFRTGYAWDDGGDPPLTDAPDSALAALTGLQGESATRALRARQHGLELD